MGLGYIKVAVSAGHEALPIDNARVVIKFKTGQILYELKTNENGITDTVRLEAPDIEHTLEPEDEGPYYTTCDVEVYAEHYNTCIVHDVQIFDTEISILPVNMLPLPQDEMQVPFIFEIDIPENDLHFPNSNNHNYSDPMRNLMNDQTNTLQGSQVSSVLRDVIIPEYITVHLGSPNAYAENVRVKFIDYIKNVASSEIYPTWPNAALEANIYCQISFALNRIYTEWYPSRGFSFNITNSTAFDQYFVYGRNIYQNISNIVDRIFNVYIRRQGHREPFFAQYCNGTTVTCNGLSQWGTVPLANSGMSPIEILRYYFPKDVETVSSNTFDNVYESYPGVALRQGNRSDSVQMIQNCLNRIRSNFPLIPLIPNPNGLFDSYTTSAVTVFQQTFSLVPDGIIGRSTWNRILSTYVGVTNLADLESEGHRIGIGDIPPTSVISEGSRGRDVVELQFILNTIAQFYPGVPTVIQNGLFDSATKASVIAFQNMFGLTGDGVVGPSTWQRLYYIFNGIDENVSIPESPETFPGTSLRVGSTGSSVSLMQRYLNTLSTVYTSIPRLTVDGIFGNATRASVIEFQRLFALVADGVIGPITWDKIVEQFHRISVISYPGTSLKLGSSGSDVALMQKYLNGIARARPSIPTLNVDGIFGNATRNAVVAFQREFGLTADGIIGIITWNAIVAEYNKLNDSQPIVQSLAKKNIVEPKLVDSILMSAIMVNMF